MTGAALFGAACGALEAWATGGNVLKGATLGAIQGAKLGLVFASAFAVPYLGTALAIAGSFEAGYDIGTTATQNPKLAAVKALCMAAAVGLAAD